MSVDLPKMEVHTRGEDCEHDELETVGDCFRNRGVVSGNAQHDLEMRTSGTRRRRHTECAECQRLDLRVEGCTNTEE